MFYNVKCLRKLWYYQHMIENTKAIMNKANTLTVKIVANAVLHFILELSWDYVYHLQRRDL